MSSLMAKLSSLMANERGSHGVQEEDIVDEAAVVALSSLPARHIDALDVKVVSLGIFLGWEQIPHKLEEQKFQSTICCEIGSGVVFFQE